MNYAKIQISPSLTRVGFLKGNFFLLLINVVMISSLHIFKENMIGGIIFISLAIYGLILEITLVHRRLKNIFPTKDIFAVWIIFVTLSLITMGLVYLLLFLLPPNKMLKCNKDLP